MKLIIKLLYIQLILNFCFIANSYAQKDADSIFRYRRLERTIQYVHILIFGSYSTIRVMRLSNIVSM